MIRRLARIPPSPPLPHQRHSGRRGPQREEESRARARVKTRKNAAVTAYARDNSRGSASKLHARLRGAPGFRLRREHPLDLQLELDARRPEQARSRTAVGGITYY